MSDFVKDTNVSYEDTISRQAAIDALDGNVIVTNRESAQAVMDYIRECADRIRSLPSAQPDHSGDVNGMVDLIDRQAAIDALTHKWDGMVTSVFDVVNSLPSTQPDLDSAYSEGYTAAESKYRKMWDEMPKIIRCKDCKHWKKTCGDESWSVGDCDVFDEKLVMCKGFCAWAERRTDG